MLVKELDLPFSVINKISRQEVRKGAEELETSINQRDLINIYKRQNPDALRSNGMSPKWTKFCTTNKSDKDSETSIKDLSV
jgi:hypothetical protein